MIAIPTIHLNGTGRDDLLDGLCEAISALHHAGRKIAAAYPNARDYYPQGHAAIDQAMREHSARLDRIRDVANELEKIVEAIA